MQIAVLGPLEVLDDDLVPVPVPGAKERLLLAALTAGAPGVVSADRLEEALWNGAPPPTARKSLQAHLVRLRSSLEPDRAKGSTGRYVVRRAQGYALTVERSAIDALRLGDLAARGHAELASGDASAALRDLGTAVELWRGEPYADWPDAPFAEAERRRLDEVHRSAVVGLMEARLALGRHIEVLPELEALTVDEPLREDWWRLLVLALYRGGRQAEALAAGRRARALLAEELGSAPGPALRAMEAAVLAQDPALDPPVGPVPAVPDAGERRVAPTVSCPYKGLASYQVADAPLFHGRRRLIAALVGQLVDTPLLVVSGSSGAGKSSVVRAGLVPAISGGAVPGGEAWRSLIVTPGSRPVDVLAALTGEAPPGDPVFLVVDQFEELWALGNDAVERTAFLDTVLGLIDDGIVVRCVAVVRGDHLGRLAEHAAFAERLRGALVLVPALTDPELREILREPARSVGLDVDPELLDAVVVDVLGRPGALPLLSTALVGTWERRQGGRLTLGGYLATGGVAGALTRSAEEAFRELDAAGQEVARRLFVRLADVDDTGTLVRRPLPLAELDPREEQGPRRRAVAEVFVGRRLLAVDGDRLEVAHEVLLTAWPRLARWLEDDAAGRAVRRHLAPAAREWADRGRPDEELYRGARLAAALDWAGGPDADVASVESEFLDASRRRADAELEDARERARVQARARHRTRRLAVGLAAVLVVALVAAGLAVRSQRAAQRTSLTADANRLAALSATAGSLDLSFLLAAQGFRLADTPETEDGLLDGLVEHPRATRATTFSGNLFAAFLGDQGRSLAIPAGVEILRWDTTSGQPPGVLVDLRTEPAWDAWRGGDASPVDGRTVFFGGEQQAPWVRLVDGDGHVEVLPGGALVGGQPIAGAFTPDGRLLDVLVATTGAAGGGSSAWRLVQLDPSGGAPRDTGITGALPTTDAELVADISPEAAVAVVWRSDDLSRATLVDLASGNQAAVAPPARDVAVSDYRALSSGAAVLWDDGTVTLVDRAGRVVQDLGAHGAPVWDVALAPDGTWAATVGDGGETRVWDVDPVTGRWTQRESLIGHDVQVRAAEIDPTGEHLVTASADNQVIVWDVGPDGGFRSSHPGVPGRWLANEPAVVDPGRLVVAPTRPLPTGDQTIPHLGTETLGVAATFLDPRTGNVVDQVEVGDTVEDAYFGASVAVSPDGRWVAVTSGLATTILDAHTRDVVTRIVLSADGKLGVGDRPYPAGVVCCAVWTRDRLLLGTGGYLPGTLVDDKPRAAGEIAVVDPTTWRVVDHVRLENAPEVMELDADGRWLAVASANTEEIGIRDADSLQVRHHVPLDDPGSIWSFSFSPDGRLLAAGGELGKLHVIGTDTWKARTDAEVTDGEMIQVEWLPDSRTVVVTSVDGALRLFDTERGLVRTDPLPAALGGEEGFARLLPAPDDEIVAFDDQWVGLRYPMKPSVWLRDACAIAGRDLTRAEWNRFLPGREWRPTCSDLE